MSAGPYTFGQSMFSQPVVQKPLGNNIAAPSPIVANDPNAAATGNPNAAQAVRPNQGVNAQPIGNFDPSYLQNLATYIGGLFARPQNGQPLSFNPTGNLTDVFGTQPQGTGSAPTQGLPNTMLQNALNLNPTFQQNTQGTTG